MVGNAGGDAFGGMGDFLGHGSVCFINLGKFLDESHEFEVLQMLDRFPAEVLRQTLEMDVVTRKDCRNSRCILDDLGTHLV